MRSVAVCSAKDCRQATGHAELLENLTSPDAGCRLIESKCLDVCSGPVVVVGVGDDRPVVLRRVRRRKQRRDLLALLAGESLTGRLRELRVTGRRGRRAIARVRPR